MLSLLVFFSLNCKRFHTGQHSWCRLTFISVTIFFIINNSYGNKSNNNDYISSQEHKGLGRGYQHALKYTTDAVNLFF